MQNAYNNFGLERCVETCWIFNWKDGWPASSSFSQAKRNNQNSHANKLHTS
jgi:hypothetical protein